ncbi:MAG TPA: cellulase family glycosylhydrolase [Thermomicrobiales bacterium]|nr:cellulase family glycosylhydrolase [Thermomicrobiales bacterium]
MHERAHGRGLRFARRPGVAAALLAFLVILTSCGGGQQAASPTVGLPPPATAANQPAPTAAPTAANPAPASATAVSPAAASPQSTAFPMQGPHVGYGMNVWLPTADMDRTLDLLTGAGFAWARQWISWESVEPNPGVYNWTDLDPITAAAARHHVKLLIVFLRSPAWADPNHGIPADAQGKQAYAAMLAAVAQRYKGKIAAYEIWNEQNLAGETGGKVNPGEYVELLKLAFPAVKANDPGAFVLYGGLTPTGVNDPTVAVDDTIYLQQTYDYHNGEVKQYFDVLGAHVSGTLNPPDTLWPDQPGPGPGWQNDRSFYFRRVEDVRAVMEKNGDGAKQIWLTEFGWTTKNQAKGYEYGQYVTEEDQAKYLVGAYQLAAQNYPWMGVMFLWNLNFSTVSKPEDEKTPWSIVYADYSPRPAYTALKNMPKK